MSTAAESWQLTEAARARRRAEHPRPETPRVKVRLPLRRDQLLDQEFAFISLDDSCRDRTTWPWDADYRVCRRRKGHPLDDGIGHASGFGANRIRWL